ncbi:5'/3'-nucleotidase SurE [Microbacterium karelineae]|uniref:5'/3'-nucleotidase SurE n=1 Tax=Microbacterium karelineae TaxID=2654283 RepID=UPI0012EA66A9|nr:5'/3'-nucleotidase SurE [Microbacterium karelineae]
MVRNRPLARAASVAVAAIASVSLLVGAGLASADEASAKTPSTSADSSLEGLRILVTNDDSMRADQPNNTDGLGVYEIRHALCDAGADVVVIAPWQVQSGRGGAVSNGGTLHLGTEDAPDGYGADCADAPSGGPVFGVCLSETPCAADSASATPVDTVKFATRGGLEATVGWHAPDLIVSGINSGPNVASSVSDSGTVGAAMAALEEGIPAVAFSTMFDSSFGIPVENYRGTADWGTEFLIGLREAGLLEQTTFGLNVNYPDVTSGTPALPAVWTSVGTSVGGFHGYVPQEDGSYQISLGACVDSHHCVEERDDADITAMIGENRISVTPLTWDRTYGYRIDGQRELAKVRTFVEQSAPQP